MQQSLQRAQGHFTFPSKCYPYASCNDCCNVHSYRGHADPELFSGSCGWSCMLLLQLALTCIDTGPDLYTLHPDLCTLCSQLLPPASTYGDSVSPTTVGMNTPFSHVLQLALVVLLHRATGINSPLAHVVVIIHCNLCWWYFSFQS